MRRSTSRITRRSQKPDATYKLISLFIIRSDCTRHWTIGRQRRCISKASWAFLEWLCFVLFLPSNCLDFWYHHRVPRLPCEEDYKGYKLAYPIEAHELNTNVKT